MSSRPKPPSSSSSSTLSLWSVRSHVSIFVRCLHLLNFDLLEDWPNIDERTFSYKSNQQSIQQRIKAVEWSLYRLFEKYSPSETKDKLRPFFPPLAPLQSVNLRASLLRALTDLKKNGVLGKEVILRKTMLDECKGEKLEELLSSFAMIVLRQATLELATFQKQYCYALQTRPSDQWSCVTLLLAHHKGLQKCMQERKLTNEHIKAQKESLKWYAEDLDGRRQALPSQTQNKSAIETKIMEQLLTKLWSADPSWLTILQKGGGWVSSRSSYTLPTTGQPHEPDASAQARNRQRTALDDLHGRLHVLQERLHKKRIMSNSLRADVIVSGPDPTKDPTVDSSRVMCLDMHQKLHITTQPSVVGNEDIAGYEMHTIYAKLLEGLNMELSSNNRNAEGRKKFKEPLQDSHILRGTTNGRVETLRSTRGRAGESNTSARPLTQDLASEVVSNAENSDLETDHGSLANLATLDVSSEPFDGTVTTPRSSELQHVDDNQAERFTPRTGQPLLQNASHSPTPLPNIVERPSQISSSKTDEHEEVKHLTLHEAKNTSPGWQDVVQRQQSDGLTSRARQSMAGASDAVHRKRSQRKKSTSQRSSIVYPINQFETPQSSKRISIQPITTGSITPRETLFEEEADYASVFRSRPRIANSPIISPDKPSFDLSSDMGSDDLDA